MSFSCHAKALFLRQVTQQRRAWRLNACFVSAPLILCAFLYLMQFVVQTLVQTNPEYKCACQCIECCLGNSCSVAGSYCDPALGYTCNLYNSSNCGAQFSSTIQAAFCAVPTPSSWPPVMRVPAPQYRAAPWAPKLALMYADEGSGPTSGSMAASLMAESLPGLEVSLGELGSVLNQMKALVEPNRVNAYLLSLFGFTFANQVRPSTSLYYIDGAMMSTSTDALWVLLPHGACTALGLSWTTRIDLPDFITLYFSTLYPQLRPTIGLFFESMGSSFPNLVTPIVNCIEAPLIPKPSLSEINMRIYCGYKGSKSISKCINRTSPNSPYASYSAAWAFGNVSAAALDFNFIYNWTGPLPSPPNVPPTNYRLSSLINTAVRGWARLNFPSLTEKAPPGLPDPSSSQAKSVRLLGLMSFPKQASELPYNLSTLLGPLFYTWVVQLLFPTFLQQLVYEKEKRLKMMMKMHGLGDAAYWLITYCWFMALYCIYIAFLMVFGNLFGLGIFRLNSPGLQILLYLIFGQTMIALSFLFSTLFSSSKTAEAAAYFYILSLGLVCFLMIEDLFESWPLVPIIEIIPAVALYRGLYELSSYASLASSSSQDIGLTFSNLYDSNNGLLVVFAILLAEWPLLLFLAWYFEQVLGSIPGAARRDPLFFWARGSKRKLKLDAQPPAVEMFHPIPLDDIEKGATAKAFIQVEGATAKAFIQVDLQEVSGAKKSIMRQAEEEIAGKDVEEEKERAKILMANLDSSRLSCPIIIHGLAKTFPAVRGADAREAVKEISLAIEQGECFGLLGPNGAGKSTSINMLTGFMEPTTGSAMISGLDLKADLKSIYKIMGVCPQDNLLWEQLTGEEHLYFYGRLKGLKGDELKEAVKKALTSVNLATVARKRSGQYSGGMKRRLSVAISFMGQPKVVFLDEPSTGLDPASRRGLWEVVKSNKAGRALILTTHSMEEAEMLCDRLGIFVDGRLVCIGNPKEITNRYAGYLVFTITVPPNQEEAARRLVGKISPNSIITYSLGGTLKCELPNTDISLSGVFDMMNEAKQGGSIQVLDWGVANATLEEVFIKFAKASNIKSEA